MLKKNMNQSISMDEILKTCYQVSESGKICLTLARFDLAMSFSPNELKEAFLCHFLFLKHLYYGQDPSKLACYVVGTKNFCGHRCGGIRFD